MEIAAQFISVVAMATNVLSYQQKKQKGVIGFQLFGSMLFSVSYFMLGALMGGFLNLIGTIRAIIFINKKRFHADHIAWLIGFETVYLCAYALTFTVFGAETSAYRLVLELLPVIGATANTVSYRMKGAKEIRRLGLIGSPAWLIYNIVSFSIGAILCEVFSLISIVIGMIRFDRKGRQVE